MNIVSITNFVAWHLNSRVLYVTHVRYGQCRVLAGESNTSQPNQISNKYKTSAIRFTSINQLITPRCVALKFIVFLPQVWWRHQMETFSALLAICAGIHRSPVNSPHKGQRRGALIFSLNSAQINGWINNREAGDLRCIRLHYDVTIMSLRSPTVTWITYANLPEAGRGGGGSEFVPLKKKSEVGSFILLHKISRTACCFGIRTFLKTLWLL